MPIITPCWLCTAKNLPTMPTNSRSTVIGMKSPFHSPALPPPPQRPQVPPPATKANYPSLSEAKSAKSATKAHSKPPPATLSAPVSLPKKPTNHAMSLTTQRPLPPPPKQTAPSSSTSFPPDQPETPAPEESADVHMADPNSTDLSFEAMLQAQDVAMTPAQELYPDPMDTSTSPTHFASLNTPVRHSTSTHLRPTIHPPTRPTPDAPMVHAEPQTPSLFQRFAEVFRPLPFIGNLFCLSLFLIRVINSTKPQSCLRGLISSGGFSPPPLQVLTLHRPSQMTCLSPP